MKQYINIFLAATALTTVSCSDSNFDEILSGGEKEVISFSMSDEAGSPTSRAASRAGFEASTRIIARIQSDHTATSKPSLYTKCVMLALQDATTPTTETSYSKVNYSSEEGKKYWDDAYGRQGQLSVYAVAIPNSIVDTKLTESLISGGSTWDAEASPNNSIVWSVSTDQSSNPNPLAAEDLAYSHNIQDGGKDGRYVWTDGAYPAETGATTHGNGRLVFTPTDGTTGAGHFDKGHMVFKHSLSRITVTLDEGAGFDGVKTTDADFKFTTTGNNIQLNNVIVEGTLDIKAGTWSSSSTPAHITKMAPIGTHYGANGKYMAQMLPGYKFYKDDGTESVKNVMEFVIDDNTYYVTQAMIFAALDTSDNTTSGKVAIKTENSKDYIEMEQGKNYTFSITVKKTGIENLTATLVPWTEVTAQVIERDNAYFTITTEGKTSTTCDKFDLYRLNDPTDAITTTGEGGTNYYTHYTEKVSTEGTGAITETSGVYKTPWYWDDNKAFYHFRTVKPGTTLTQGDATVAGGDYFVISSGPTASTDPHWGAPMKSDAALKYSTENGFASSVHNAIGASLSAINILEHHMMANVEIIVRTPNNATGVNFMDGTTDDKTTKVALMNFYNKANVRMGTGLVNDWSDLKSEEANAVAFTKPGTYDNTQGTEYKTLGAYTYSFVPQTLNRNTGSETTEGNYVGLVITTPDANKYYVRELCKILAASVSNTTTSNQTKDNPINYWYPGHKYVYTVTVSKTGIQKITCSIVDWTTVTGNIDNITLEN